MFDITFTTWPKSATSEGWHIIFENVNCVVEVQYSGVLNVFALMGMPSYRRYGLNYWFCPWYLGHFRNRLDKGVQNSYILNRK